VFLVVLLWLGEGVEEFWYDYCYFVNVDFFGVFDMVGVFGVFGFMWFVF